MSLNLIFVDVEAFGGAPCVGWMSEFGAVEYKTRESYHGVLWYPKTGIAKDRHDPDAIRKTDEEIRMIFVDFEDWLKHFKADRLIFVSDNNGYDWQWINDGFWKYLGRNPFGHSSRRIADFYAGLVQNFYIPTRYYKSLRVTNHDHNPVNDAMGNVEAFHRMMNGERGK